MKVKGPIREAVREAQKRSEAAAKASGIELLLKGTKILWGYHPYGLDGPSFPVPGVILKCAGLSTDTHQPIYSIKIVRQVTRRKRFIFRAHASELTVVK